jgi:hypothetical protein
MRSVTGGPKLELTLRDILGSPLRALIIGHAKILSYSLAMFAFAWLVATKLYGYSAGYILEIGIANHNTLAVVMRGVFALSIFFALPLLLAGIAVPVRTIWSYGRLDVGPLLALTPKTLLHGFRSLIGCLPRLAYSLMPFIGCLFTLQMLTKNKLSPSAELLYWVAAGILFILFIRQFLILGLALTLGAAAQIDIRLAQRAVTTATGARWIQLITLIALWVAVASGLVMLDNFYNLNVWLVMSGLITCFWAFLVSFTLIALQIGFESGT